MVNEWLTDGEEIVDSWHVYIVVSEKPPISSASVE